MRFGSKTNPQKPSGSRLSYKAFAETKSCLLVEIDVMEIDVMEIKDNQQ